MGTTKLAKWMKELKEVWVTQYGGNPGVELDVGGWNGYFADGLSPAEALAEDFGHG